LVVAVMLVALILLFALNLTATVRLVRSDVYSANQRSGQLLVIWLIPIAGAMLVLAVLKPPREPVRNSPSDMAPVRDDLWLVARSDVDTSSHSGSDASTHGDS
jgi:hypothetical protein